MFQAFSTVPSNALAGAFENVTADDVRAMTCIGYMTGNPNFSAFSRALYAALYSNDTSGLDYSTIATPYSEAFFPVLPIICLDQRAYSLIPGLVL